MHLFGFRRHLVSTPCRVSATYHIHKLSLSFSVCVYIAAFPEHAICLLNDVVVEIRRDVICVPLIRRVFMFVWSYTLDWLTKLIILFLAFARSLVKLHVLHVYFSVQAKVEYFDCIY